MCGNYVKYGIWTIYFPAILDYEVRTFNQLLMCLKIAVPVRIIEDSDWMPHFVVSELNLHWQKNVHNTG